MGQVRLWVYGVLLGISVLGGLSTTVLRAATLVVPRSYDAGITCCVYYAHEGGGAAGAEIRSPSDPARTNVALELTRWNGKRLEPPEAILAIGGAAVIGRGREDTRAAARRAIAALGPGAASVSITVDPGNGLLRATRQRRLEPHGSISLADLWGTGVGIAVLLMGVMGLLTLGARAGGTAPRHFVLLCLAGSLPIVVVTLPYAWLHLVMPLYALPGGGWLPWLPVGFVVWPPAVGYTFLSLLSVFPTESPEVMDRFRVPRPGPVRSWMMGTGAALAIILLALTRWGAHGPEGLAATLAWIFVGIAGLTAVFYAASWLDQAVRRIWHAIQFRLEQAKESGEDARRARMAVLGLHLGMMAFGLAFAVVVGTMVFAMALGAVFGLLHIPIGPVASSRIFQALNAIVPGLAGFAVLVGIMAPFLGMGVAILRSGLWNVDLVAYRAILYSLLGVAFFFVWASADQAIQAVVPGGVAWAGPVVAAAAVAALQGPLARAVRRRFRPDAADFDEVVARTAERLAGVEERGPGVLARVAAVLAEELRTAPAVVFSRAGADRWHAVGSGAAEHTKHADVIATALGRATTTVVRTDGGTLLAARLGPVRSMAGMVLVGPRGGGRFYSSAERRMLGVMLAPVTPLLRA